MDDGSNRRFDHKREGIHDRVSDVEEFDLEAADLDRFFWRDGVKLRFAQQPVLLQLVFHESDRERRPVYRNIQVRKDEWQRADMVFVAVRQEDALDFALVF
jgi:hypothetical protein